MRKLPLLVLLAARGSRRERALLFMATAVIGLGTLFYHNVEGWRWLDALYFCVVTLVTIASTSAWVSNGRPTMK